MTDNLDPVVFEVVWHRLLDITEEMGIKYMRTSGSPILVGAYDASTAITLPDGQLVAMGPYITTQAHVMRLIVEGVTKSRSINPGINAGDMFICNDPYLGATHQPDVATVAPVHAGQDLIGWVGSSGHWLDVGGSEPGGFNMNAQSVFDEGLRLPPTRIVEGGEIREDIVELIMAQIREPLAELDLRGQLVANEVGRNRLLEIVDSFGASVLDRVMRRGIDHVEQKMRERLRELPDGVWREVQYLDHDGHDHHVRAIVCTAIKRGDKLTLDFTGSDPQVEGFANCAYGGLRAAALSGLCIALGYDMTWNDGVARCVDIKVPPKTIVSAEYPAPVSMSTISAIITTLNLVLVTLSRMLLLSRKHHDEAMASWCATSLGVSMAGVNRDGILTVAPEASHFAAGCGARSYADGVDTGGIIINTTANIPSIEATEDAYPLLYLFRRQLVDSGGPGRRRGGVSGEVAIRPYQAPHGLVTSFAGVGSLTPNAVGIAGGLPGAAVRFVRYHLPGGELDVSTVTDLDTAERVPCMINSSKLPFTDETVEYHNWQGGGGFGDPLDREPALVAEDVAAGLVSAQQARDVYGVVLDDDGSTPRHRVTETAALRDELRAERLASSIAFSEHHPIPQAADLRPLDGAGGATLAYWDVVTIDLDRDQSSCAGCGHDLGPARRDFRLGCVYQERAAFQSGPLYGADYAPQAADTVNLRYFYCPGCGRQLEVDLVVPGKPGPSFGLGALAHGEEHSRA